MDNEAVGTTPTTWGRHLEFVLSCIGYCVGLGNLWRFPYLCMKNGGGAFLIPYFCFLILLGMPLMFLEMSLGQFSRLGPVDVWKFCPLLKGVGIASATATVLCMTYYNMVTAWALYYIGHSFSWTLPWATCHNSWNTDACVQRDNVTDSGDAEPNGTLLTSNVTTLSDAFGYSQRSSFVNFSNFHQNSSHNISLAFAETRTPSEEFWHYNVLEMSSSIAQPGGVRWQLVLCLLGAWVIVFICIFNGIKTSGKAVYVTATAPYLLLTVLLIRASIMDGAINGVIYYIVPDFEKLKSLNVWLDAALQILFSTATGWGVVLSMTSYNKFNNNHLRDAVCVVLVNAATSVFAGFVIFAVIGVMAKQAGVSVAKVVTSGPGLAFVVYPEAITKLPGAPIWALLFFLMVVALILDSQFVMVEMLATIVMNRFPRLRDRRKIVTFITCACGFLMGLPFTSRAGMYVYQIVDWYCALLVITIISLLETLSVSYLYGGARISYDISLMLGRRPSLWWRICWGFLTPAILMAILVLTLEGMTPPKYGTYLYPTWALGMGWVIAVVSILPIPICMIMEIIKAKGPFTKRIHLLVTPAEIWGPSSEGYKVHYRYKTNKLSNTNDSLGILDHKL